MTTATTDEAADVEARKRELEEEVERLEERRNEVADELDEAESAVEAAREAHREGRASADDLADAQSRASALRAALEELEGRLTVARSDLRDVGREIRERDEFREVVEAVRRAEAIYEEWDERRVELAAAIREGAREVADLEEELEEVADRLSDERNLHRRIREAGLDADKAVLERKLHGINVRPPSRSDLGEVEGIIDEIIERERDAR